MRCMAVAVFGTLLLSGPALGAAGDVVIVTGDRVNVRSGPGTEHAVRREVSRDQPLVEIERQGDWVHAEIAGTDGADGWIHGSLVAPASNGSPLKTANAELEKEIASWRTSLTSAVELTFPSWARPAGTKLLLP